MSTEEEGGAGGSSVVSKRVEGNPILKYLGVAAASIVSMSLAGSVVKRGSVTAGLKMQEAFGHTERFQGAVQNFRKVEKYLDELQGITRTFDNDDPNKLFSRIDASRKRSRAIRTDSVVQTDSANRRLADSGLDAWLLRDELQQRLVRQARRLPYELPGFYVAQKAIIDPMFGEEDGKKVNWSNPIDVVSDFAAESIRNVAFNVLPFEGAGAAGKSTYRHLAGKLSSTHGGSAGVESTRMLLEQLGVSATELLNKTLKLSNQTIGAFSDSIRSATDHQKSFGEFVKLASTQYTHAKKAVANAGAARRNFETFRQMAKNGDLRRDALDSLPSPFKGMGSGFSTFGKTFKQRGQTYDDWQDLISGRKTFKQIQGAAPDRASRLTAFMERGGGTFMEKFARDAAKLGGPASLNKDGTIKESFRGTDFFIGRREIEYRSMVLDSLSTRLGLSKEEATKFVRVANKFEPFSASRNGESIAVGEKIMERIEFSRNPFLGSSGKDMSKWWDEIVKSAKAHNIELPRGGMEDFMGAVRSADVRFSHKGFNKMLDHQIAREWDRAITDIIPNSVGKAIKGIRTPFEEFQGSNLQKNKEFLIRRTAERLNVNVLDDSGGRRALIGIENDLVRKGIDTRDLNLMRGILIDKKDIAKPWQRDGANLFGFKALSVGQALDNGFYSTASKDEQQLIETFVKRKTTNPGSSVTEDSLWKVKTGGVYTNADGTVVDLGRLKRSFTGAVDILASEFRIPIVGFNPLQMVGHKSSMAQRKAPSIQLYSRLADNRFLDTGGKDFNAYMWVRDSNSGNKGSVFGFSSGAITTKAEKLAGQYKSRIADATSMSGRSGRVLLGESGMPKSDVALNQLDDEFGGQKLSRRRKAKDTFNKLFDVAHTQEDSIIGNKQSLFSRFRAGRGNEGRALSIPHKMARKLSEGPLTGEFTDDMSEGMQGIIETLRKTGFSPKAIKEISRSKEFSHAFAPLAGRDLFDITDNELVSMAREILEKDAKNKLITGSPAARARQELSGIITQSRKQDDFWDMPASNRAGTTVSRRIDELRMSLADYLLTTSGPRSLNPESDIIGSLFSKIDELHKTGAISKGEKGEARAAVLSMRIGQIQRESYIANSRGASNGIVQFDVNKAVAEALANGGEEISAVLREVSNLNISSQRGWKQTAKRVASKHFATTPHTRQYEVNPFGSDRYLLPTFGSVVDRVGIGGALKGALWRWDDATTASTPTLGVAHAFTRLNKYAETFGLGLDISQYRGGMDFYARGLIGKRVLPAVAAGSTFLALDRTAGGMVNKDEEGNRIYAPLTIGLAADAIKNIQVGMAGLIPGGMTAEQKREKIESGEVAVRENRYWLLGNSPWRGGKVQYFRPSWYQRIKSGSAYIPELNETPLERLAFGYDFSPLRPLDPYRREREDALSRPYPLSGDYFTGPWGMLNPALNATIGKVLKPKRELNPEYTQAFLSQYQPVGQSGAYYGGEAASSQIALMVNQQISDINAGYQSRGGGSSGAMYPSLGYASPRGRASAEVRGRAEQITQMYSDSAQAQPGSYLPLENVLVSYGVPIERGYMTPRIVTSGAPVDATSMSMQARQFGYRTQEAMGIYGFGFGSVRTALGMGSQDYTPDRAVLESADRGYSSARAFWGLNIGGAGDVNIPGGRNIELSEIVRRFVPKDQAGVQYVNELPNLMGAMYPWLPGSDNPTANVKTGDPYTRVKDAELRLPGTGYKRTQTLFSDQYGDIGLVNMHDILGSIAPYSNEYRAVDKMVDSAASNPLAQAKIRQTRAQVEAVGMRHEFTPYEHDGTLDYVSTPLETGIEKALHMDNFFLDKTIGRRTALEDWERNHVYGSTFPSWTNPVESYLDPFVQKSTQRNPASAALAGGFLGSLFGSTKRVKAITSTVGAMVGAGSSVYGKMYQAITGDRYMPTDRKKEIALEEAADIFKYTKSMVNASRAAAMGDQALSSQFLQESKKTMYGVDLNMAPEQLAQVLPGRKREHFEAMLYAPEKDREQILSTAGRLERRLFQAAWGMKVEARPDLEDYYSEHELPPLESEAWDPLTNPEHIKIKMGQHMGLDLAQMGYYPQQIKEANLVNPAYPNFYQGTPQSRIAEIRRLMQMQGISGDVFAMPNMFSYDRVDVSSGVF